MASRPLARTSGGLEARAAARELAIAALAGLLAACGTGSKDPPREYATEWTFVVTSVGTPDTDGCGVPQKPLSRDATYRWRVAWGDQSPSVTDILGGCVLAARMENDVVIADGAECTIPPGAPLHDVAVISRTYTLFRLDRREGTVQTRALMLADTTQGHARDCFVTDERIVESR